MVSTVEATTEAWAQTHPVLAGVVPHAPTPSLWERAQGHFQGSGLWRQFVATESESLKGQLITAHMMNMHPSTGPVPLLPCPWPIPNLQI